MGDGRKREFSIRKIREGPGLGKTTSKALWQVGKMKLCCEGGVHWQTGLPQKVGPQGCVRVNGRGAGSGDVGGGSQQQPGE